MWYLSSTATPFFSLKREAVDTLAAVADLKEVCC